MHSLSDDELALSITKLLLSNIVHPQKPKMIAVSFDGEAKPLRAETSTTGLAECVVLTSRGIITHIIFYYERYEVV